MLYFPIWIRHCYKWATKDLKQRYCPYATTFSYCPANIVGRGWRGRCRTGGATEALEFAWHTWEIWQSAGICHHSDQKSLSRQTQSEKANRHHRRSNSQQSSSRKSIPECRKKKHCRGFAKDYRYTSATAAGHYQNERCGGIWSRGNCRNYRNQYWSGESKSLESPQKSTRRIY